MKTKNKKDLDEYTEPIETIVDEPLSAEEIKILEASHEGEIDRSTLPPHDNTDLAKAKRYVKKNKFTVLFVVVTIVLLAAVIGTLAFMLYKVNSGKPSTKDFSVTMGEEEFTIPYKKATKDGVFYFDMRLIADYTELIVSGGDGRIKFSCPDGTYVRFEHNGETATVNGTRVFLDGKAKITDKDEDSKGECLVPFSFIEKLFSYRFVENHASVTVRWSTKDNTVLIRRIVYKETGEPLPISFSADCFDIADDAQMQYYQHIYPELSYACEKMTLLVNKSNPLGEDYVPDGLLSLNELGYPDAEEREFLLISNVAQSLDAMLKALNTTLEGKEKIVVTSAYRSYDYQVLLFEKYVTDIMTTNGVDREKAESIVTKTAARQGESEHQSGLCVDLIEYGKLNLDESFENTAAFEWLSQNAHKYGFILRYPKGKESITGYDYEPWHFRFVGLDAATVIYEDNICLEEYLSKY